MDFVPMYTVSEKAFILSLLRDLPRDCIESIWRMSQELPPRIPMAPRAMTRPRSKTLQSLLMRRRRMELKSNLTGKASPRKNLEQLYNGC